MQTLKLSSTGPEVKKLQSFLKIKADGIFGIQTEREVMVFQYVHHLKVDGIVGKKTWQELYNAGYDAENLQEVDRFEIENYFLPEHKYFQGPTTKKWIFLHHTHGWHDPYKVINDWKNRSTKVATHFVIGGIDVQNKDHRFDGLILQSMPDNAFAWHLGVGNTKIHRESIGIELCSFGYLNKGFTIKTINGHKQKVILNPAKFYTTTGVEVQPSQVEVLPKPFRGQKYFHKYSEKQLKALKNLIEYLAYTQQIQIDKGLPHLIKSNDSSAFEFKGSKFCANIPGVWSHANVAKNKWDVSPQNEMIKTFKLL
jgi:N-acetyl-anhydromuramyl-L-alanine amidase AmpD